MLKSKVTPIYKYIFAVLAAMFLMIFVFAGTCSAYAGDTGTGGGTGSGDGSGTGSGAAAPTVEGIVSAYVLYKTEEIEINATKQVYYCQLKKGDVTSVKPAELIPAVKNGTFELYYIDISTIATSKQNFIGLATTLTPGADGMVPVMPISINAAAKKVDFQINWGVEGDAAKSYGILSRVVITGSDGVTTTYDHTGEKKVTTLPIQWRKGSNGDWNDIDKLSRVKWETMRNSGAVLYFRIAAIDQTGQKTGQPFGKEFKIKLAVTKAPAVKLDAAKLTLALKNGMQFRVTGQNDSKWKTILPVSKDGKDGSAIRDTSLTTTFDPYTEQTKTKINAISLADCYAALGISEPSGTETVSIDYRMAATNKKPASRTGVIVVPSQTAAPTMTFTADEKGYVISGITKAAADLTENPAFEYTLVLQADLTAGKFDDTTAKWAAAKNNAVLKKDNKAAYTLTDGTKRTITITDKDVVLLFRRKGVNGSAKKATVLASKYAVLQIPVPAATPTPTPTAESTPTATPST